MKHPTRTALDPPRPRARAHAAILRRMATSPPEGLMTLYQRVGPVASVGVGPYRYVAMLGADANRFLFAERPDAFTWREAMSVLVPIDGETAMVVSDGDDHDRRRRAAQPAFTQRRIASYLPVMMEEIQREIGQWGHGECIDVLAAVRRPISRVMIRCLFGDLERADELVAQLDILGGYVGLPIWRQFKIDAPGSRWRRAMRARVRSDEVVFAAIRRRRELSGSASPADVLGLLLSAVDRDGQPALSDQEVRDQAISIYAATFDTVRATSAWLMYEMVSSRAIWGAATDEIRSVVGDGPLRGEHLSQLKYLDCVINETLRLWPSSAVSARYAKETVEYAGFTIPCGSQVLWSAYVSHRLPEYWLDPDRFWPERWMVHDPEPYSFVPFGGGARQCIGFAFARQLLKVLAVQVLRTVHLTCSVRAPTAAGIPALHPRDGVPVTVRHR